MIAGKDALLTSIAELEGVAKSAGIGTNQKQSKPQSAKPAPQQVQ